MADMEDTKIGAMETLLTAHESIVKSEPENDDILSTMEIPKFIRPPKIKGKPSSDLEEFEDASITDKLKTAKHTRITLDHLRKILEDKADLYPECNQFQKEAEEICNLTSMPRVLVGVLGATGCGKSSLLNALLDEKTLLPCNGMRASTSAVVEVAYNRSENSGQRFRVEIDFDDERELIEQAFYWQDDINNGMDGEKPDSKSNSDAAIALSKLKAVFPGVSVDQLTSTPPKDLLKLRDLSDVLGKTKTIYKSKAKDMHNVIKSFVDSNNKLSDGSLWPLVKVVRLYTKSSILKSGLVLVDVPGVGDSNTARSSIALRYMNNLDHIFIVADIVRAVDEQIAKDLLGRSLRDRLYMDNKYNAVTFILTKTDIINTEEVMESLNLQESTLKLEIEQSQRLEKHLEAARKQRKRKRDEKAVELTALNEQIEQIRHSQGRLKLQMKMKCIEARNTWSSERLEADFQEGIKETELEMADLEDKETPRKEYAEYRPSKFNSFCVSSTAFHSLKGKMHLEYDKVGFGSPEATNIPALQHFAMELTSDENEKLVDNFVMRWKILRPKLQSFVETKDADVKLSLDQTQELREVLNIHLQEFNRSCFNTTKGVIKGMRKVLTQNITHKIEKIDLENWQDETIRSEEHGMKDLRWSTFKAACRRLGYFPRRYRKHINFNGAFADLLLRPIARPWRDTFKQKMGQKYGQFIKDIMKHMETFKTSFEASMSKICEKPYYPAEKLLEQVELLEPLFQDNVLDALRRFRKDAIETRQAIEPLLKTLMTPAYKSCSTITGIGCYKKMLKELDDFVVKNAVPFAETVRKDLIKKRFVEITETQRKTLTEAAKSIQDSITTEFTYMIDNAVSKPGTAKKDQQKFQLRQEISTLLKKLNETLQKELKNPEAELHTAANYFVKEGLIPAEGSSEDADDVESVVSESDDERPLNLGSESEDDSTESDGSDDEPDSQEKTEEAYHVRELFGVPKEPIGAFGGTGELDVIDIDSLMENQARIAEQAMAKETEESDENLFVTPSP